MMRQYTANVNKEDMEHELLKMTCEFPLLPTLPTVFTFETSKESILLQPHYSSKLADLIYSNLQVFRDRDWTATLTLISPGIVVVFFGNKERELELPKILDSNIIGHC